MSEPVLKAIMRLFALVAKEDFVTKQERDHIKTFLEDHLSQKAVEAHLGMFDEYTSQFSANLSPQQEAETISSICSEINAEVAQKQKSVIMMELMDIILADGSISSREDFLAKAIGAALNVQTSDIDLIKDYVLAKTPADADREEILVINSIQSAPGKHKHIYREELNGHIFILYLKSNDSYFFKYIGHTDVYLNGAPQKSGNINVLATSSKRSMMERAQALKQEASPISLKTAG
jgi:uncharacterized tellurite resistance protein B-like protein